MQIRKTPVNGNATKSGNDSQSIMTGPWIQMSQMNRGSKKQDIENVYLWLAQKSGDSSTRHHKEFKEINDFLVLNRQKNGDGKDVKRLFELLVEIHKDDLAAEQMHVALRMFEVLDMVVELSGAKR
ncbi:MAG: hypothetical protein NTV88_01555 [Candidatus Micrarchaeota archaeon]|nr:hypothetical protein [Candidatus Micrarchaeota archaeon]